ncbi:putative Zinc finger, SWIM-type [Helianthus debilis subsp. tardiflorus]
MILNNICEVFNKQLVGARDMKIITCLEYIREYLTKRIINVKKIIAKSDGPLSPAATIMFDSIKNEVSQYNVLMTSSSNYQVTDSRNKTVVDVQMRTCSCRKWDLIGMHCKHVVAAIWNMSEMV